MEPKSLILGKDQIAQKITRIAHEIYENHYEADQLYFFAIEKRGVIFANRLAQELEKLSGIQVVVINLKINKKAPEKSDFKLSVTPNELKNKTIFLIDDVLNSGKTLIFAATQLLKFPVKALRTVILVNRKHRLFPIHADFVGLSLATTLKEHISVEFEGENEGVYLS